jgi:uncharacterized protein (TIGR01777 family)
MKILVTGSTGLVGSALIPHLAGGGHSVTRLVRSKKSLAKNEVAWDPAAGTIDGAGLEGLDAVVHLAGENIAAGRWTSEKKARIRDSRVKGTRLLAETLSRLAKPPKVLVSVSAIGYYGDRGNETLVEDSGPGTGFLAEVCRAWETAAEPAARSGIRVVHPRIGVVLSPDGGALKMMLLPFKMGIGGKIGSGEQYMSWIALDELIGVIQHVLTVDTLTGAVNAVAPRPVTNLEFTKSLGRVLSRPTMMPLPAFAAKFALGEMADELLLASARVEPARLLASGYKFRHPELEGALRHVLRK